MAIKDKAKASEDHTRRVRRICMGMPGCEGETLARRADVVRAQTSVRHVRK